MISRDKSLIDILEREWESFIRLDPPRSWREIPRWLARWMDRNFLYTEEIEYIDREDVSAAVKEEIIRVVEWWSRFLGIAFIASLHLLPMVRKIHGLTGRPVRILDVGTGNGDIICRIAKILPRLSRIPVKLFGLDYNPRYVELGRKKAAEQYGVDVTFLVGNAFDMEIENDRYDILMTNWMIHHLRPVELYRMVREFDRVATHGVLLFDIARAWLTYFVMLPLSIAMREPARHDTLTTIRKGYRPEEMDFILRKARVDYYIQRRGIIGGIHIPGVNVYGGLKSL